MKAETLLAESSYVSALLFQRDVQAVNYYRKLLNIRADYGYVIVLQTGKEDENGQLTDSVEMNIQLQSTYIKICNAIKETFYCMVGMVMASCIPIVVPCEISEDPYKQRINIVKDAILLINKIVSGEKMPFRVGIGRIHEMDALEHSYHEALLALKGSCISITHFDDFSQKGQYIEDFPVRNEKRLFYFLSEGNEEGTLQETKRLFDWMLEYHSQNINNIRLKILEYVIWGEKIAGESGTANYDLCYRQDYLAKVISLSTYQELQKWFQKEMVNICHVIKKQKEAAQFYNEKIKKQI